MPEIVSLQHFVTAQDRVMEQVLAELTAGHKQSHWMWFVFPQLAGLGRSEISRRFALASKVEARAFYDHPVLGPRLRDCCARVLAHPDRGATGIFGALDAQKLQSSMTLFREAAPECPLFGRVLDRFFHGDADQKTLDLLLSN